LPPAKDFYACEAFVVADYEFRLLDLSCFVKGEKLGVFVYGWRWLEDT
jgi:hypothetical protein